MTVFAVAQDVVIKSRHCFKLNCSCCEKDDHTAVMDGIEGLELKDKK